MNHLHEVIYQLVANPELLSEVTQNTQVLLQKFNLAHHEAQALLAMLKDSSLTHSLLSPKFLHHMTIALSEQAWTPPDVPTP
jgi:hypothetical protein